MAVVVAGMALTLGGCKKDAPKMTETQQLRQENAVQFNQVNSQLSEISTKLDNMPAQPANGTTITGFGEPGPAFTPTPKPVRPNISDFGQTVPTPRPGKTTKGKSSSSKVVVVSGVTVQQVQRALANAGFNPGKADGVAGPKTVSAIKQFQAAEGLKADGVVGQRTWDRLRKHTR